jgi:hypothetical protein
MLFLAGPTTLLLACFRAARASAVAFLPAVFPAARTFLLAAAVSSAAFRRTRGSAAALRTAFSTRLLVAKAAAALANRFGAPAMESLPVIGKPICLMAGPIAVPSVTGAAQMLL